MGAWFKQPFFCSRGRQVHCLQFSKAKGGRRKMTPKVNKISTGISGLDEVLLGGLIPGLS